MAAVLNHAGSIEKITFFMEECKRMGLKVLGPDVNESRQGFAVNQQGEIRVGLGGLKGVGEAAVISVIDEREKNGKYKNIFDLMKRINQRTANKKTLESLAYAGAFDCFTEIHRAQYFHLHPGDSSTGIEKLIKFGNMIQTNSMQNNHSLFGQLAMPEVAMPKIPNCEAWTLTELLDHEKEVIGMFMSGHPLDHFRFEILHYGITRISDLNDFKEAITLQANPQKNFRLAGLVIDAQHRVTKTGKQFGSFVLEDYSGKTEFLLWSEDYSRFSNYLEKGTNLFLTGNFRQRFNKSEFEFKVDKIILLESIKQQLTRQLIVDISASAVNEEMIQFLEENVKKHPGRASLRFNILEPRTQARIGLHTLERAFEMNDEMATFLENRPEMDVQVVTN
jgi:DNA polymerase-3 subunit alpha